MSDVFTFLAQEVRACHRCDLRELCRAPVPGLGSVTSPLFIVGQSPGQKEDRAGEPFVGPAGAVLRETLTKVGFPKGHYYLTNATKCHPPGNAKAKLHQWASCWHWLQAEMALWNPPKDKPRMIVTLGDQAYIALFGREFEKDCHFAQARKRTDLTWDGHPVRACLHPAVVLYKPRFRMEFEDELAQVAEFLGVRERVSGETTHYHLVRGPEGVKGLLEELAGPLVEAYALDTEFLSDGSPLGVSISWERGHAAFLPVGTPGLAQLLGFIWGSEGTIVLHSSQMDVPILCRLAERPIASWPWERTQDTCVAAYVLREPGVGLKDLAAKLGMRMRSFEDLAATPEVFAELPLQEQALYAAADADATLRLWNEVFRSRVAPGVVRSS